jgi:Tfp pilus assembly protein PilV
MEVIFAVAILGISMVTLLGLEIKTIRLQQIAERTTVATMLAKAKMIEKMAEIGQEPSPSLYFNEGDFEEEAYEYYHWEYTLSTTEADTLYRIDLTVFWDADHKATSSVTFSSFIKVAAS